MIKLENNERELLVVRRHWFVFIVQAISLAFAALFPLIGFGILSILKTITFTPEVSTTVGHLLAIAYVVWLLILWIVFFVMWTNYYLDMLILTDSKVIRVEQRALFSREMSTFRLDRLQDITIEVHGIIPTFLNFGTLRIQTAGEMEEFLIRGIPHPYEVKNSILQASQRQIEEWKHPPAVTPVGG
jgi:hypothetical protein